MHFYVWYFNITSAPKQGSSEGPVTKGLCKVPDGVTKHPSMGLGKPIGEGFCDVLKQGASRASYI